MHFDGLSFVRESDKRSRIYLLLRDKNGQVREEDSACGAKRLVRSSEPVSSGPCGTVVAPFGRSPSPNEIRGIRTHRDAENRSEPSLPRSPLRIAPPAPLWISGMKLRETLLLIPVIRSGILEIRFRRGMPVVRDVHQRRFVAYGMSSTPAATWEPRWPDAARRPMALALLGSLSSVGARSRGRFDDRYAARRGAAPPIVRSAAAAATRVERALQFLALGCERIRFLRRVSTVAVALFKADWQRSPQPFFFLSEASRPFAVEMSRTGEQHGSTPSG